MYYRPESISVGEIEELRMFYDLEVRYVDEEVGRLLEELEEMGVGVDNSYFIVTADHGELLGEHGALWHGGLLYEPLVRVPLIVAGPSVKPGLKIDSQVCLMDLAPTILDLIGGGRAESFMGESLKPLLEESGSGVREWERPIILEYAGAGVRRYACRTRRWKYILTITARGVEEELYDLGRKPIESVNMVDETDILESFRKIVLRHISAELVTWRRSVLKSSLMRRISSLKELLSRMRGTPRLGG